MSNFKTRQVNEEESFSQSSDEKMDTGSESFRSQDTPNSIRSSDFDDKSESNVLRLQNPENGVLRLSEPENDNVTSKKQQLTDSFVDKMSNLHIDSPLRPKNLGLSESKKTALVLTTSHPLMVSSPDYPDVIPKKPKDLEFISNTEDDKPNGYSMYSPNTNNSKNNLYFSENYTTAECTNSNTNEAWGTVDEKEAWCTVSDIKETCPDVARVSQRRKIIPRFLDTPPKQSSLSRLDNAPSSQTIKELKFNDWDQQLTGTSTPKGSSNDIEDHDQGVTEWCKSTQIRTVPNFDLPIELSSNLALDNDLDSPDVLSSSRSELSPYEAQLDPATGRAALRPTRPRAQQSPNTTRRKIMLPPEEDRCSLDSVSVSLESEDEPPELGPGEVEPSPHTAHSDAGKDAKPPRPCSCSECSDAIPEYSAAEELRNERSYVSVSTGDTHATCDMKVIEPYKRVLSHGGYDPQGSAIIVFSACHLPDTARTDYRYVMDNLFLYVMWTLDRLIGEEYILVYLHGSAGARRLPSFRWLHECYRLIDRRLRKSLKHLYLVHPTFWLKSFVILTKPFVSSKFFRKLSYVRNLEHLSNLVPVQSNAIPDLVRQYDIAKR